MGSVLLRTPFPKAAHGKGRRKSLREEEGEEKER
jgi:hypothetical protein